MKRVFSIVCTLLCAVACLAVNRTLDFEAPHLKLEVNVCDSGVFVKSLNIEETTWGIPEGRMLFGMSGTVIVDGKQTSVSVNPSQRWKKIKVRNRRSYALITFRGNLDVPGGDDLRIGVRIIRPDRKASEWYENACVRLSWDGCEIPAGITVREATLLPLDLNGIVSGDRLIYPSESGIVTCPRERKLDLSMGYPGHLGSMAWFALWNETGNGLYFAAQDADARHKTLKVHSGADGKLGLRFIYPLEMTHDNISILRGNNIVLAAFKGDWFDAASMYKEWVKNESCWYPRDKMGPEGRIDTPMWMKELCVWAQWGDKKIRFFRECPWSQAGQRTVIEFQDSLGVPIGLHWYNWHKIPFNNDYPHYFPPIDGFEEMVEEFQNHHVYVMPYINARLWDKVDSGTRDSLFTSYAAKATIKNANGDMSFETFGNWEEDGTPTWLSPMCPSTQLWKDKVKEVVNRLAADPAKNGFGVNAVYLDQVAANIPTPCYDRNHDHPLGGGSWWVSSYNDMLARIRTDLPSDVAITSECNAEAYAANLDGYLTWHFQGNGLVPAFAAVYGGAVQLFGRGYSGDSSNLAYKMKMAQSFVFGEQLGWLNPSILNVSELFSFFRDLVHLRYQFREYFYKGEMCRVPRLEGDNPVNKVQWSFSWRLHDVENPSVLSGSWRIPSEGRQIYMFSNYSNEPVSLKFACGLDEQLAHGARLTLFLPDGSSRSLEQISEVFTFDPCSSFVIEAIESNK